MFNRIAMSVLFCSVFFMTACGGGGDSKDVADKGGADKSADKSSDSAKDSAKGDGNKRVIAYSAMSLENPFFKIIADNIKESAEANGFAFKLDDASSDVATQRKHIENYIAQGVAAIVINPTDRVAIGSAIKKANEAGIPVFTCDLQCVAEGVKIAGHIGTDNFQGGKLAGQAMIEALGDAGGDVLVLHFKQANSCVLRVDGFNEVIKKHNAGKDSGTIDVISVLDGKASKDGGYNATADALQAHQDLRGIFAINDPSGLGAWKAVDQAVRTDLITIIAFDGEKEGKQAIKDGKIYADPIQFPAKMGKVTVANIIKYLDGESYEENVLIPTSLYKKAQADEDPDLK